MRAMIVILMLASIPAAARPVYLHLKWDEFRTVIGHGNYRQKVIVQTGDYGRHRNKGRLASVTETGVVLQVRKSQTVIDRSDVHSIQMLPRMGLPGKWRTWAAIGMFPLWLVGFHVGLGIPGGIPEGRFWKLGRRTAQGVALGFALPAGVYWLAHRADTRNGTVIVRLRDRRKEKQP